MMRTHHMTIASQHVHAAICLSFAFITLNSANAQLWHQFAHPNVPHVDDYSGMSITIPDLVNDSNAVIRLPVLVVLLEFRDKAHLATHPPAFFQDMIFGTGSGVWTSVRPSTKQTIEASSNGRLLLVPANETSGTANDGVVGWVNAQCPPGTTSPPACDTFDYYAGTYIEKKRAEGIRRAAPFINYASYDTMDRNWNSLPNGDGLITSNELVVVVVNADDLCRDQHDAVGHPDPASLSCPAGNARVTDPRNVPVDDVLVRQSVAGLTETGHANVFAHEFGHQIFGLGDLYSVDLDECWPAASVEHGDYCYPKLGCGANCKKAYNDECANAVCLEDGVTVTSSTENSGGTDVSTCSVNDSADVWFTYTPEVSEDVTISMCVPGCGASTSVLDTTLALFNGCNRSQLGGSGACVDDFDCNGDGTITPPCERAAQITRFLNAGSTYYVRVSGYDGATGSYQLTVQGGSGACNMLTARWFPPVPDNYSLMSWDPDGYVIHLDPWAKLHLGFVKPRIVTHDGYYTLYDAETDRSFPQQDASPEALVIYDPLRPDAYREYFIVENRDATTVPSVTPQNTFDRGLAVWQINENPMPDESKIDARRAVRLIKRGGHQANNRNALWDGSNPIEGYDLTPTSSPRDTSWTNGSKSWVEVRDISPAGPVMTFFVRMPPFFVDHNAFGPFGNGSETFPFSDVDDGVTEVGLQDLDGDGLQDGSRTIRIAGGSYPEAMVIDTPCTLMGWKNGTVRIGE